MKQTNLPPISINQDNKSLVEKYQQEEQKAKQYCYKPYRTLSNYLQ